MGQGVKVAVYSVGAMVLGAIMFAMLSSSKHEAPPSGDVTISWQLDSLATASDAPPPPVAEYAPTWIPMSSSGSSSKGGGIGIDLVLVRVGILVHRTRVQIIGR